MTKTNKFNAPWSLHFDRDGTEDIAIIRDAGGSDLATSCHFWLPEGDDPTPHTLAAMRAMVVAPDLLVALRIVVEMEYDRDEESRNFDAERLRHFASLVARAGGEGSMKKTLPSDPDGMNDNRAAWAGAALTTFMQVTGTDEEDAVGDLLADLIHWCDRNNYDFDAAFERSRGHYHAETLAEDTEMKPVVVVTVQGGLVQDVHSTKPVDVFVEDWDCPPDRPLVMDFVSEPLTPEQQLRIEQRLAENTDTTGERL